MCLRLYIHSYLQTLQRWQRSVQTSIFPVWRNSWTRCNRWCFMLELSGAASKKSNLVRLLEATLGSLSTQLLSEMTETEKGTKNLLIRSVACDLKICLNYRQENVTSSQKWSGCKIVYYCWSFSNLFFFFLYRDSKEWR